MIHTVSTLGIQSPARFALALEAPFSVSTEALLAEAQVLKAFVDIDTLTLLRVESEAARTGTKEGTRKIPASSRRLAQRRTTFILVLTIPSVARQFKALLANTGDSAHSVFAATISTKADHGSALVDIPAFANRSQLEAGMAGTSVASRQIKTGAIATEARISAAFVYVYALVSRRSKSETLSTYALEAAGDIGASPIAADSRPGCTLVQIPTFSARGPEGVSLRAGAMEASLSVLALSIPLTWTWPCFKAFVLVNALVRAFIVRKPTVTVTPETAQKVHAGAVLADIGHHLAFVDLLQVASQWVDNLTRPSAPTKCSVFRTSLKR